MLHRAIFYRVSVGDATNPFAKKAAGRPASPTELHTALTGHTVNSSILLFLRACECEKAVGSEPGPLSPSCWPRRRASCSCVRDQAIRVPAAPEAKAAGKSSRTADPDMRGGGAVPCCEPASRAWRARGGVRRAWRDDGPGDMPMPDTRMAVSDARHGATPPPLGLSNWKQLMPTPRDPPSLPHTHTHTPAFGFRLSIDRSPWHLDGLDP